MKISFFTEDVFFNENGCVYPFLADQVSLIFLYNFRDRFTICTIISRLCLLHTYREVVTGLLYTVMSQGVFLSAQMQSSIDISAIVTELNSVLISGSATAESYGSYVYMGDYEMLVKKSDCTFFVTKQMVSELHYEQIATEVISAIMVMEPSKSPSFEIYYC